MNDRVCKFMQMSFMDRKFQIMTDCNRLSKAVFTGNMDLGRSIVNDLRMMCEVMAKEDVNSVMEAL